MGLSRAVAYSFDLIFLVLFITILLTWFPIKWYNEPFRSLKAFSEYFFAPARRIIPPIGMIDISPIAVFILLSIVRTIILNILAYFNL